MVEELRKLGGMGWRRDLPDFRDYTIETKEVSAVLNKFWIFKKKEKILPRSVDLREWCSPIEDQDRIGSCGSHAGVGLMEYFQRRAFGKHLDMSRLYLYKTARDLLGLKGDQGSTLRAIMTAMVRYGVPPESLWPYDISKFDDEPPDDVCTAALDFQATRYYRLDSRRGSTRQTLRHILKVLTAGLPVMFGFTVFSSMPGLGDGIGDIPMPRYGDKVVGGHAICAVGFDRNRMIGKYEGALLIRNSWGTDWGSAGHGWLPVSYVLDGLAADFWSLVQAEFVNSGLCKSW